MAPLIVPLPLPLRQGVQLEINGDDAAVFHAAQPTSAPAPIALGKRNVNGPSTGLTYTPTPTALGQAASTSSAASPTDSSVYSLFGGGLPTNVLNYVAIFLVALVVVTLISARYIFLKRYGPVTPRTYFIPPGGIHFKYLGIHIRGPPDRSPPISASSLHGYMTAREQRRRRRRGRDTTGADIREGGRRGGARDADDGASIISENELPKYEIDTSLPGYNEANTAATTTAAAAAGDSPDGTTGEAATQRTSGESSSSSPSPTAAAAAAAGTSSALNDADVELTDVQRYEAQTRGITLPPRAHTATEGEIVRSGPSTSTRPPLRNVPSANPPPSYEMQEMRPASESRRENDDDDDDNETRPPPRS